MTNGLKIVGLDVETTGLRPETDRIVEIAIVSHGAAYCELVNPGIPIPAEATAIHGIEDADVGGCPPFSAIAEEVRERVEGACLLTYNGRSFDTLFLHHELERATGRGLDLETQPEIDLFHCWRELEPRTLEGALSRFLDEDHIGPAHTAQEDAHAALRLLPAFLRAFGLGEAEDLLELTRPEWEVDRHGKLRLENGQVVFGFGKHRGEPVGEHESYAEWMLGADFPEETKQILRALASNGYRWPVVARAT